MEKTFLNILKSESIIVEKLKNMGYPQESIVLEGRLRNRHYVDILIMDTKTKIPVLAIEIKIGDCEYLRRAEKIAFEQLKEYYNINMPIKMVLAKIDTTSNQVSFVDFTEAIKENKIEQKIEDYTLPQYDDLIVGADWKNIQNEKREQKKRIGMLKVLCWGIYPIITIAVFLLDKFEIYTLSLYRLIVLGGCVLLTLIPCFKEISIGQISLKGAIEQEKSIDDKEKILE